MDGPETVWRVSWVEHKLEGNQLVTQERVEWCSHPAQVQSLDDALRGYKEITVIECEAWPKNQAQS